MKIDGGCHCGHIRYEAEVDPATAAICHCTDCQVLSSSAFRTVVMGSEADFRLLTGVPKVYVKTAASGARREQVFCPECGTQLYATSVDPYPRMFGIRIGSCNQRTQIKPVKHVWSESALDWVMDIQSAVGETT